MSRSQGQTLRGDATRRHRESGPDEPAALAELDAISGGPYDFGVFAAKIAKASILWTQHASSDAEPFMFEALTEWYAHQAAQRQSRRDPVEEDVAAIRNVVVRPGGGGALGGWAGNVLGQDSLGLFVILNPDVSVKFAGGDTSRQSVYQSLADADRVLLLNKEQQSVLSDIVTQLGGKPIQGQTPALDRHPGPLE